MKLTQCNSTVRDEATQGAVGSGAESDLKAHRQLATYLLLAKG